MGKRLDAEDTVDVALHFLHRLQSDGWGVGKIEHEIEYGSIKDGGTLLPIAATVTIQLIPARPR